MPKPSEIKLHQKSRVLEVHFDDGFKCNLSCEYLRVFSPSAEVQGHGPGQETLQTDKEDVNINEILPIGHYAVKLVFDDKHDSGLYTWNYIYDLGKNYQTYWQEYLQKLSDAGIERRES